MRTIFTLSIDGCDRATAYHMANKIVLAPDGLYVTWLDREYRSQLARVNPGTGAVETVFPVAQGMDNHCGAALVRAPDGQFHALAGGHCSAFIHRWSDRPADPASWSLPEAVGCSATYPSFVCTPDGTLCVAYRQTIWGGHWGVGLQRRQQGEAWSWPMKLVEAAAPLYTFPGNSLTLGPDGTIHLLVEFFKTYPENRTPAHTMAVEHFESPDGGRTWLLGDGRPVSVVPVRLEDAQPIRYKGGGNLRVGNLAIMPDGNPAFTICDTNATTFELLVRRPGRRWEAFDLTRDLTAGHPGWVPNYIGALAADRAGRLVVAAPVAPDTQWAHPEAELRVLWIDPGEGRVLHRATVPKLDPGVPDWLPSIEQNLAGRPDHDPFLLYTSGRTGTTCNGGPASRVRLLQLSDAWREGLGS